MWQKSHQSGYGINQDVYTAWMGWVYFDQEDDGCNLTLLNFPGLDYEDDHLKA